MGTRRRPWKVLFEVNLKENDLKDFDIWKFKTSKRKR